MLTKIVSERYTKAIKRIIQEYRKKSHIVSESRFDPLVDYKPDVLSYTIDATYD